MNNKTEHVKVAMVKKSCPNTQQIELEINRSLYRTLNLICQNLVKNSSHLAHEQLSPTNESTCLITQWKATFRKFDKKEHND